MTGLGRAQLNAGAANVEFVIRSVNFRGLDIKCRLPQELSALEPKIHQLVGEHCSRGRIEIDAKVQASSEKLSSFVVNEDVAVSAYRALTSLQARLETVALITMNDILQMPGVIRTTLSDVGVSYDDVGERVFVAALQDLQRSRHYEGERLQSSLRDMLATVDGLLRGIREMSLCDTKNRFVRLQVRLDEISDKFNFDQDRLHQEFALLVERSDFTEEIDRLDAHEQHFADLCRGGGAIGRKLDFLCQEMLRETNTLLSKAYDSQITVKAIDLKAEIERIREQVQNIE